MAIGAGRSVIEKALPEKSKAERQAALGPGIRPSGPRCAQACRAATGPLAPGREGTGHPGRGPSRGVPAPPYLRGPGRGR